MANAARSARKRKIVNNLGKFFLEQGKILTLEEYLKTPGVPYRRAHILEYCRTYNMMVAMVLKQYPELGNNDE